QPEHLAGLRLGRDLHLGVTVERRDVDVAAEGRRREADRQLAVQVGAVALEHRVGLEADDDVEVAGRAAVDTGFAFAREADAIVLVDTGGNLDGERLVLAHAPRALAGRAGIGDHLAAAVALRAGLLQREEALRHAYLAAAVAGRALLRRRARLGAAAVAGRALLERGDADLRFGAARRVLERELEVVAQVGAAIHAVATAPAALLAEDLAEDVAERVGEAAEAFGAARARAESRGGIDARVAELVVGRALARVGQDLVGLLALLEFLLGVLVPGVAVRVVLHREAPIGLLDLVLGGVAIDAEHRVKVALGHGLCGCAARRGRDAPIEMDAAGAHGSPACRFAMAANSTGCAQRFAPRAAANRRTARTAPRRSPSLA